MQNYMCMQTLNLHPKHAVYTPQNNKGFKSVC